MTKAAKYDAARAAEVAAFNIFNPIRIAFTAKNSTVSYEDFFAAKKVYDAALEAYKAA